MSSEQPQTKKFQKGERLITPASQKASKYYPAEDVSAPKTVRSPLERLDVERDKIWERQGKRDDSSFKEPAH